MSVLQRHDPRRLFPDLLDLLETPFAGWVPQASPPTAQMIRVEDYVEDGSYVVRAELPGIDPDKDVEITVTGDTLRIHAERQIESKEGHRSEFRYGSFTRSIALPRDVTAKDITASYGNGILTITMPIPETKQEAHRVPVESASSPDKS
jgi:HSP20 family molecular chaperone IbpA